MAIEKSANGGITITGKDIDLYRMLAQKHALSLEIKGLKLSRGSIYAMIKKEYNLKGSKVRVYEQFCTLIDRKTRQKAEQLGYA